MECNLGCTALPTLWMGPDPTSWARGGIVSGKSDAARKGAPAHARPHVLERSDLGVIPVTLERLDLFGSSVWRLWWRERERWRVLGGKSAGRGQ